MSCKKQEKSVPNPSLTLKNGFPTLKIGGGVPYTPTRPLLLPYTLVGTLPRICHIYIYIYIYIYLQSTPLSQLSVAPPHGSKVRAKGTKWCIHVVEGAKLGQNALERG